LAVLESFSRFIDAFLPSTLQEDPEQHAHARTTVGGLFVAAPFVFFLAFEQHFAYGMWSVTVPVLLAGVGFLVVPTLFRVLPPRRVRDVGALVIYLTIFAVGFARGGLHLAIVSWNFVLIFGAGLFSQKPMTVLWGWLFLVQIGVLYGVRRAELLPYVAPNAFQEMFSIATLLFWSVAMAVLVARARDRRDAERRALAEQVDTLRRIEALGRLSGGIAHDFNNLLTVVSAHARLLAEELEDPGHLEDIDAIEQAARRGRDVTVRLLAMTRGEPEEPQRVDVAELLQDFSRFVKLAVPETMRIHMDLEDGAYADVERAALEQMLLNACINAADAMPDGGRMRLEARVVDLDQPLVGPQGPVAAGRWVRIVVEDDGVGMAPEVLERMFDAFFTTKSRADGTGIGLSSAFATVQRLEGRLVVESTVGAGTTFMVFLPWRAAPGPAHGVEPERTSLGASRSGLRVLLADDEPGVRRVIRRLLEQHGLVVTEAVDGADALERYQQEPDAFGLIVTDVIMPRMTGVELFEAIRKEAPSLPFVFVSGYADGSDRVTLSAADATFVEKPFTHGTLLRALDHALSVQVTDG